MTPPPSGITADVIREVMPPYHLSPDLLEATLAALPPPPPGASAAWRQARLTRLMQEISTLMPANAAQARTASEILIVRELANAIAARAYAPDLTVPQMCRVGRVSAELRRTATGMMRTLERSQQMPAPFFGTVLADEVDVAAVDAAWGGGRTDDSGAVTPQPDPPIPPPDLPTFLPDAPTPAPNPPTPPPDLGPLCGPSPQGEGECMAGENPELDAMNRESTPEATVAQGAAAQSAGAQGLGMTA
jgi:hypothetical protein